MPSTRCLRGRSNKRELVPWASPDVPVSQMSSGVVTPDFTTSHSAKRVKLEHDSPIRGDKVPSSSELAQIPVQVSISVKRPSEEECAYIVRELGKLHPSVLEDTKEQTKSSDSQSCGLQRDILDGVVSTMLSQNTTNANSTRAFANLKKAFPTWDTVAKLPSPAKLEEAIHCGGLAKIKAQRILSICQTLQQERGSPPSLEYLRDCSNAEIQKELMRFPGLGKKTISCVLLFTLRREEFPVDTHVYRIAKQLKWVPTNYSRDDAYDYLNSVVPPKLKRNLHCLLIQHGRECHRCAARGKPQFPPRDGSKLDCPLKSLCSVKALL